MTAEPITDEEVEAFVERQRELLGGMPQGSTLVAGPMSWLKCYDHAVARIDQERERGDQAERKLRKAVEAHISIATAYRTGGQTPEKAIDTMKAIRKELGL